MAKKARGSMATRVRAKTLGKGSAARHGEGAAGNSLTVPDEQIAVRAYFLYLSRGAAPGHDLDDWLQAERELVEQARLAPRP